MPRVRAIPFDSLKLRLIAFAAVWTALGLVLGYVILSGLFRAAVERSFDNRLMADLEIVLAAVTPEADGSLRFERASLDPRFESALSGWYWQVDDVPDLAPGVAPMTPLRSTSLWDNTLAPPELPFDALRVAKGYTTGPDNQQLRVVQREISFPDLAAAARGEGRRSRDYRFTVAGDRASIEAEIAAFNTTLAGAMAGLGAGLLIAILIQVQIGLNPLRRVGEALAAIRSGRAQRLEGRFPAEIAPLAAELNALVAHNAEIVARARTHVGNLAHFLKTPLTVLSNEAQAAPGALGEAVMKQTQIMRRQVDHYLARARAAATGDVLGARTEIAPVITDLARTLEKIHARRGVEVDADVPADLAFRGERQDFEELVGNLMDNACKYGRTLVEVRAARLPPGRIVIAVSDDGPGLKPEERARVLKRGERLDESVPGSGLGLAIVRDIARLYGGDIALEEADELGGVKAVLTLPAAEG